MCVFNIKSGAVIIQTRVHAELYWAVLQQVVLGHSNKAGSHRVTAGHLAMEWASHAKNPRLEMLMVHFTF